MADFENIIGRVYDCAANPALWPDTLEVIREKLGDAYASVTLETPHACRFEAPRKSGTEQQRQLAELLSPHLRRAIMINEVVHKGKLATALYGRVLDSLISAVFIVGHGRRLVFSNAAAEKTLCETGQLAVTNGMLVATGGCRHAQALNAAVDRALASDATSPVSGIAVPLPSDSGQGIAAYVLPLAGKELGGTDGHCAIFIAQRSDHQPMVMEMLCTIFKMTPSEARISWCVSCGMVPAVIAKTLGLSVNTVRTHLKHAFAKSSTSDQTTLSAAVNKLTPPIGPI